MKFKELFQTKQQRIRWIVGSSIIVLLTVALIIIGLFIPTQKSYCDKVYDQCLKLVNQNQDNKATKIISINYDNDLKSLEIIGRNETEIHAYTTVVPTANSYDEVLDFLSGYGNPGAYELDTYTPYIDPNFLTNLTIYDGKEPNILYSIYKSTTDNYYCSLSILAKDKLFHSSGKLTYNPTTHLAAGVEALPGYSEQTDSKVRTFIRYVLYK